MTVREAMTDYFASAHISSTISDAMEKMLQEGLGILFIVDDKSQLVGSIDESLLLEAVFDVKRKVDSVTLHMNRKFVAVRPDDSVNEVIEKFRVFGRSEFPVISGSKLIGVLTRRQLIRAVLRRSRGEKPALFA